MIDLSHVAWRKSSRSGAVSDNCVEVADLPGGVAVRDSKNPDGGSLAVPPAVWRRTVADLKAGRYDL
jgi:hypothetical protein